MFSEYLQAQGNIRSNSQAQPEFQGGFYDLCG